MKEKIYQLLPDFFQGFFDVLDWRLAHLAVPADWRTDRLPHFAEIAGAKK